MTSASALSEAPTIGAEIVEKIAALLNLDATRK
jgi:hypothetical protein